MNNLNRELCTYYVYESVYCSPSPDINFPYIEACSLSTFMNPNPNSSVCCVYACDVGSLTLSDRVAEEKRLLDAFESSTHEQAATTNEAHRDSRAPTLTSERSAPAEYSLQGDAQQIEAVPASKVLHLAMAMRNS